MKKSRIVGINGSASEHSANLAILQWIARFGESDFDLQLLNPLHTLPHFQSQFTDNAVPERIITSRNLIEEADGVIISTPEYVFSIPSGLKNALEWCVSTLVFANKPIGIITAAAHGEKGHAELQLIMQTLQAKFSDDTCLLIQGVKGKIDKEGLIKDLATEEKLKQFVQEFCKLLK